MFRSSDILIRIKNKKPLNIDVIYFKETILKLKWDKTELFGPDRNSIKFETTKRIEDRFITSKRPICVSSFGH